MHEGIAIHLAPEALFYIGSLPITNTIITTAVVSLILILFAFVAGRSLRLKPSKFQAVIELLVTFPYDFVRDTLQNDKIAERIYPIIMTIFLLVLGVNWFGLLPFASEGLGSRITPGAITPWLFSSATDLNFTLAIAIVAFLAIEFFGVTTLGVVTYGRKFFTLKNFPIGTAVGLIEFISELARLISFSFRLFGNVFAGKVLILVIMFFVPYLLPVPFLAFETFVGFIQAAIFALLTLFFTKIAIAIHEEHGVEVAGHEGAQGVGTLAT